MNNVSELVEQNIGLVHSCAQRFKGRGIDYDDLFQAGCVGLVKASERFDAKLGYKFSTYAVPNILGEIKQLFRDNGSVKISRSLKELSMKIHSASEILEKELGYKPGVEAIAKRLGVDSESIAQAMNASVTPASIDEMSESFGESVNVFVDFQEDTLVELIALKKVIKELDRDDQLLILLRFYKDYTQARVAKFLGITQVQVSRREKVLLKLLREKLM